MAERTKPDRRGSDRRERGASLLETAIAAPLFLLLVIGMIDVGRAVWIHNSLGYVARDGVRYASLRSDESDDPADEQKILTWVLAQNTGLDPGRLTLQGTWDPSNSPGSTVQVDLAYEFVPVSSIVGLGPFSVTSSARLIISN